MANETSNHTSTDTTEFFLAIVDNCNDVNYSGVRVPLEIITIVLCFPSNVVLLWLMLNGCIALSPSNVLGLGLSVVNITYCLTLPLDVYISLTFRSGVLLSVTEAFSILNLAGCPLLLTCMCLERYMATVHPVLYMKVGSKWKYRVICLTLICVITLSVSVITYQERLPKLIMYLSISLELCLLIMLACLMGIIHVLSKKGPGERLRGGASLKNRALRNTLLILIPSTVIYGPLMGLLPYILTLQRDDTEVTYTKCLLLNVCHTFPSLGGCIGPVFYMSRMKRLVCGTKDKTMPQKPQVNS